MAACWSGAARSAPRPSANRASEEPPAVLTPWHGCIAWRGRLPGRTYLHGASNQGIDLFLDDLTSVAMHFLLHPDRDSSWRVPRETASGAGGCRCPRDLSRATGSSGTTTSASFITTSISCRSRRLATQNVVVTIFSLSSISTSARRLPLFRPKF